MAGGRSSYARRPTRARKGGALAVLAAIAKLKGLLLLLKASKFGLTLATMLVSVAAYAAFFGVWFGLGLVLLLLVHEMGHWAVLRAKGVPAGAPVFVPFLGALIAMRGRPRNVKDEAEIGIGGPLAGTTAALLVGSAAAFVPAGHVRSLLYALAYTGMLLNLFNLLPVSPLDGGRIAGAISRWAWPAGLVLLVLLLLAHPSGILVLILLIGGGETLGRFLGRDGAARVPGYYTIEPRERTAMAVAYFGLLGVTFAGMVLFHAQLLAISGGAV